MKQVFSIIMCLMTMQCYSQTQTDFFMKSAYKDPLRNNWERGWVGETFFSGKKVLIKIDTTYMLNKHGKTYEGYDRTYYFIPPVYPSIDNDSAIVFYLVTMPNEKDVIEINNLFDFSDFEFNGKNYPYPLLRHGVMFSDIKYFRGKWDGKMESISEYERVKRWKRHITDDHYGFESLRLSRWTKTMGLGVKRYYSLHATKIRYFKNTDEFIIGDTKYYDEVGMELLYKPQGEHSLILKKGTHVKRKEGGEGYDLFENIFNAIIIKLNGNGNDKD